MVDLIMQLRQQSFDVLKNNNSVLTVAGEKVFNIANGGV